MSEQDESADEEGGQFRDPGGIIARLADAEIASQAEYRGRSLEEIEHNRRLHGQTYRELHGRDIDHDVLFCIHDSHQGTSFPSAMHGKIRVRPASDTPAFDLEPTRGERVSAWLGACAAAFWEGVTYPWRASQDHRIALIRDVIQDAMEAGLTAEVVQICPACEAHEAGEVDIPMQGSAAE